MANSQVKYLYFLSLSTLVTISVFLHFETLRANYRKFRHNRCLLPLPGNASNLLPFMKEVPNNIQSIFFIETSCNTNYHVQLTARQACSIESAARAHPEQPIFVLFAAPRIADQIQMEITALSQYPNVHFRNIDVWEYSKNTPLEKLFESLQFMDSQYFNVHLSDILRFLTLWKYGGLYLDMDTICLKRLDLLGVNFAGAETNTSIGSSVINFSKKATGHVIAQLCLKNLAKHFNGNIWNHNGPALLTRIIGAWCREELTSKMTAEQCSGFRILPVSAFMPVHWHNNTFYFDKETADSTMKILEDSYVAHVFNHMNKYRKIEKGSVVPYDILAKKYCPRVYKTINNVF